MNGHGLSNDFFIPSYLKRSRYVAKLEAADKAKKAAERERPQSSHPGSLSRSASNASLPRMVPGTHRGMAYEIVERAPPGEQEHLMPLPSKWSDVEKNPGLDLLADGSEVRYNGPSSKTEMDAAAVRADYPMSPQCGIYYYEVEIKSKSKDGMIAVGFSNRKAALDRLPGWENDSWAYHGDDGKIFYGESTGKTYGQTFTAGDIIGCGLNFWTSSSFFTKNGQELGTAFKELKNMRPFPSVGMKKHTGTWIGANFGQRPFIFDIDAMMTRERLKVEREIQTTKVAHLRPRLSDHAPVNGKLKPVSAIQEEEGECRLIQELVAQLLAHDGYVETAKAFTTEVKEQAVPLEAKNDAMEDLEVEEDHDAVNRQSKMLDPKPSVDADAPLDIRRSILDGDIDRALKHTHAYYPHVLERNPPIVFRLKCRKFVELIRRYSDLQNLPTQKSSKTTNGHADVVDGEVFEQDMDMDDNISEEAKWGDSMDTDSQGSGMKSEQLLQEAMEYGQVLMQEYREERNEYKKRLEEVFSLIAYHDARNSIHGHLLDPKGRVAVAEELNSAILGEFPILGPWSQTC